MGVKLVASSGGSVELVPTNTASNFTVTVPAKSGTMSMDGPAFSAYKNATQSISSGTATKVLFQTEEFDTNSNFASSTFTPTVAGYYQITAGCGTGGLLAFSYASVYKNSTEYKRGVQAAGVAGIISNTVAALVYCNGSTDFVEIYWFQAAGTSQTLSTDSFLNYFQASMVRGA
jgi:hypothetical protein